MGVGAGPGDPYPLGAGLGVQFLPPIWFGDGAGAWKRGRGRGYSNPSPIRPIAMSRRKEEEDLGRGGS